jgi:hypothetical protein
LWITRKLFAGEKLCTNLIKGGANLFAQIACRRKLTHFSGGVLGTSPGSSPNPHRQDYRAALVQNREVSLIRFADFIYYRNERHFRLSHGIRQHTEGLAAKRGMYLSLSNRQPVDVLCGVHCSMRGSDHAIHISFNLYSALGWLLGFNRMSAKQSGP